MVLQPAQLRVQEIDEADLEALKKAVRGLENPNFLMVVAEKVDQPIEALLRHLPDMAKQRMQRWTDKSLRVALDLAIRSMGVDGRFTGPQWLHTPTTVVTGGISGFFGGPAIALEFR